MELALTVVVVVIALGFDFTNGFHDAANAIATAVGTKALTPTVALAVAAVFELRGGVRGLLDWKRCRPDHPECHHARAPGTPASRWWRPRWSGRSCGT